MKITQTTRSTMRNMLVNVRLNSDISQVSSINKTSKLEQPSNGMSSNASVLIKESFYDKISDNKIRKNELKINNDEKQNNPKKQNNIFTVSKEDRETLDFLYSIFEKFNIATDNVKKIDLIRNQNNFFNIKDIVNKNINLLSSLGITIDKSDHFHIDEKVFVKEIMKEPQKLKLLLDPSIGVIRKICDSFGKFLI